MTGAEYHDVARWWDRPPSPRELEALRLAADGLTRDETAARLGRSLETVKTQRKRAIFKLRAANITHAVAIALRRGLIE